MKYKFLFLLVGCFSMNYSTKAINKNGGEGGSMMAMLKDDVKSHPTLYTLLPLAPHFFFLVDPFSPCLARNTYPFFLICILSIITTFIISFVLFFIYKIKPKDPESKEEGLMPFKDGFWRIFRFVGCTSLAFVLTVGILRGSLPAYYDRVGNLFWRFNNTNRIFNNKKPVFYLSNIGFVFLNAFHYVFNAFVVFYLSLSLGPSEKPGRVEQK